MSRLRQTMLLASVVVLLDSQRDLILVPHAKALQKKLSRPLSREEQKHWDRHHRLLMFVCHFLPSTYLLMIIYRAQTRKKTMMTMTTIDFKTLRMKLDFSLEGHMMKTTTRQIEYTKV